jgi:hypothetical protein
MGAQFSQFEMQVRQRNFQGLWKCGCLLPWPCVKKYVWKFGIREITKNYKSNAKSYTTGDLRLYAGALKITVH